MEERCIGRTQKDIGDLYSRQAMASPECVDGSLPCKSIYGVFIASERYCHKDAVINLPSCFSLALSGFGGGVLG